MTTTQTSERVVRFVARLKQSRKLQIGWGISAFWLLAGTLLLFSRILGSFSPDADAIRALGSILLLNGFVLSFNWVLVRDNQKQPASSWDVLFWAGFSFTGSSGLTLALLPASSSVVVLLAIGSLLVLSFFLADFSLTAFAKNLEIIATKHLTSKATSSHTIEPEQKEKPQGDLTQWLSRKRDQQGTEIVEGMIRIEIAAGQIQKSAHVTLTPALAYLPEIECEPLADAEIETDIADIYPHGFRIEIRRTDTNREAVEVEIGFQATCPQSNQNAA